MLCILGCTALAGEVNTYTTSHQRTLSVALAAAGDCDKDRLFLQLLYGTGMRLREGLRLRVKTYGGGRVGSHADDIPQQLKPETNFQRIAQAS